MRQLVIVDVVQISINKAKQSIKTDANIYHKLCFAWRNDSAFSSRNHDLVIAIFRLIASIILVPIVYT